MLQKRALAALRIVWLGAILTGGISWVSAQQILSVSSQTVAAGSNVTVDVNLNQGNGIGGIQFDLLYDSGFLRIVDSNSNGNLSEEVQRGSLLEAGHLMVANATDPGRIAVVIAGTTSFLAGSGSVVRVTFQVLGTAGSTALTLNNVIASDPLGSSVAVSSSGGTITVQGASNQAPNAVNDTAVTAEDTPVTINVLANDTDPNGDALTVSSVNPPAHGTATIQNGTTVRYVPELNFFGSDSFTYTADDGRGGTDTASVSVNVTPVNDPPNARSDTAETPHDTPVAVSVLSNDSDPDGDTLTITTVTQPIHGSATIQNGTAVVYTPSPGYEGSDSFSYTVSDGKGGTASAQVTITVQQAPPGPALLLFPQFVDGGDSGDSAKPNSSRIIIRNNSEQEATLRLLFRNANGTPLEVPVQGQAGPVSEVHRTIEAMGVEEVETAGTGSLKSGIVEVEPLSGDPSKLQGTLVFSLFGTFVSSESSPAQSESPVFVSVDPDTTLGENTGIAAYNPDPTNSATVRLRLLDANGVEVASRSNVVIGPQQQLLGYVSDDGFFRSYFDSLGAPFLGTLDIVVTSGPDIAVLGLVQKTQALGSALTALSGAGASSASGLFFPQFYEGGDAAGSPQPNSTRIVIRNGSSSAAGRVRLAFRDSAGNSVRVPIQGVETSSVDRDIQSLGMTRVETDGTGPASFGVVEVTPVGGTSSFTGALTYSIFGTFVSVGNSPARSSQRVFISVNPDPVLGEDTGLALYNPSASQSATLRLVLRNDLGDTVATRDNLVIGPRQQLLGFAAESAFFQTFFDAQSGSFLGTVEITVTSGPDVAALGLLQKTQAFNHALVSVAASGN